MFSYCLAIQGNEIGYKKEKKIEKDSFAQRNVQNNVFTESEYVKKIKREKQRKQ